MLMSSFLNWITTGLLILTATIVINASEFITTGLAAGGQIGSSSKIISSYTASDVVYIFGDDEPTVNGVVLRLELTDDTPAPTELRVKLVSHSDTWFDCTVNTGHQWVCDTTDSMVHAVDVDQLNVIGARSAWN